MVWGGWRLEVAADLRGDHAATRVPVGLELT
jgi:hypothetical protein